MTTETSIAASLPLAKKGSRTSAGRSSLPGRSPAGSFRGPRAARNAAVRRMKWSIRNNADDIHLNKPELELIHLMNQQKLAHLHWKADS